LNSIVLSTITKKLETSSQSRKDAKEVMIESQENNGGATRYFVNIGSRDNFDWMSLKIT
jgi:ATP-dependent RNA helicase DeaD